MQKIMIIEDDQAVREELSLLLENEGYHPIPVTAFHNITQQAAREMPDLILLDLGLPEQDGLSLCADLRRSSPKTTIDSSEYYGLKLHPAKGTATANGHTTELKRNVLPYA